VRSIIGFVIIIIIIIIKKSFIEYIQGLKENNNEIFG